MSGGAIAGLVIGVLVGLFQNRRFSRCLIDPFYHAVVESITAITGSSFPNALSLSREGGRFKEDLLVSSCDFGT